jgi:hypothetical protein
MLEGNRSLYIQLKKIEVQSFKRIFVKFKGESDIWIDYEGNPLNQPKKFDVYIESGLYRAVIDFKPDNEIDCKVRSR